MPLYTFACDLCGTRTDELRSVENRHDSFACLCGGEMKRRVELFQDRTFEPYYDEGLGCDISSLREKKRVMKALNVIETGDRVQGARNFDKHAPTHVRKFPPQGIPFQRAREGDQVIETVNRDGTVVSRAKFSELPKS